MPQPPTLTPDQRDKALAKAAAARRARSALKERLKSGDMTLAELFEAVGSDEHIAGMKVLAVIESLPGVGKVRARRAIQSIGIAETRRVRGLGAQQRDALLAEFGG